MEILTKENVKKLKLKVGDMLLFKRSDRVCFLDVILEKKNGGYYISKSYQFHNNLLEEDKEEFIHSSVFNTK